MGLCRLGVQVREWARGTAAELPSALERVRSTQPDALFVLDDLLITSVKRDILDLAHRNRVPVMSLCEEFVQNGGSMS